MIFKGRFASHSRHKESQESKCETERHNGGGIFAYPPGTLWWEVRNSGHPSTFDQNHPLNEPDKTFQG